jgi:heme/copper-type cytochrome/quinol oxidase subunit 1
VTATDLRPSQTGAEGEGVAVFERPPALIQFLDDTEEAIRRRLAKMRLFERVFLLQRDWMTRITMLMLIAGLVWGAVGGFDAFGFQTQVVAYATQSNLHLSTQEIYSSITLHGIRELFGFAQQVEMAVFGLLLINALGITPRRKWTLYLSVGLLNASMLLLQGPIYLAPFNDNYFPAIGWYFLSPLGVNGSSAYVVSPIFFLGWIALAGAALLWTWWMAAHVLDWYRQHAAAAAGRRYPVFLWFLMGTLVLMPLTYGPLIVAAGWDMLAAYAGVALSPLTNQVVFWMFGHAIVYVLFLLPIVGLYVLIPILARRPIYSYRFAVASAIMFVVLTPLLGIHHLYLTPLPAWSSWITMFLSFAIVIPSAITFFSVWMTLKGVPGSQWEWNAVALFSALAFGGSIFGGLTGPINATIPADVDVHNSMFVLAHFHAITILAIVAGGFALLYAFFPVLTGRRWFSARLAQVHFLFTLVGGTTIVLAMDQLGNLGVLRREVILPIVPAITEYQLLLFAGIVVMLVGQLFLVANGFLTVLRGALFSASGLSFDEAVRLAAQSTTPPAARVPVHDLPFARRAPRPRRERAEAAWIASVAIFLAFAVTASTPGAFSVSNGISGSGGDPANTEFVALYGQQYYWTATESGAINGTFDNAIVAYAGQWVQLNMTASGATQSVYLPFRDQAPVNTQVVPGSTSYASFAAPTQPGVYGAPDGEYDGPWFGVDVAALIVLPVPGATGQSLADFTANGGAGDIYDPPVVTAATASLVANPEGVFNFSVPGPTLAATVPGAGGPVAFTWEVPLSSIGITNYLVNVTSTAANAQQQYVIDHNYTLPYPFELERIDPATGLVGVSSGPLRIDATETVSATLAPGVYLYGLTNPVAYSYDPNGESGSGSGVQTGLVMGLWGVLWVSAA